MNQDVDAGKAFQHLSNTVAQFARENAVLKAQLEAVQEQLSAAALAGAMATAPQDGTEE